MDGVIIGVDPHKASVTIEVRDRREVLRATGRFPTDKAGHRQHGMIGRWPGSDSTSGSPSGTRHCGRSCSIRRWWTRRSACSPTWRPRPGAGVRRRDRAHRPPPERPRRSGTRDRVVPGDGGPTARPGRWRGHRRHRRRLRYGHRGRGRFTLVYLLRNTITNLTSQDEQVRAFGNAAAHLRPGGCFLIENYVPELRRLPPGETRHVFIATADHVGVEEYDVAAQLALSRHYWTIDGQLRTFSSPTATRGPPNSTSWPGSPGSPASPVDRLAAHTVHR